MAEGIGDLLDGGVDSAGDGNPGEYPLRKKDDLSAEQAFGHHPHQKEQPQGEEQSHPGNMGFKPELPHLEGKLHNPHPLQDPGHGDPRSRVDKLKEQFQHVKGGQGGKQRQGAEDEMVAHRLEHVRRVLLSRLHYSKINPMSATTVPKTAPMMTGLHRVLIRSLVPTRRAVSRYTRRAMSRWRIIRATDVAMQKAIDVVMLGSQWGRPRR